MYETVYSSEQNRYATLEKQFRSSHNRRCIDNTVTGCNKCVGYCQYDEHPGFLTEKLRKQHNCIGKQCFHYVAKPGKKKMSQTLRDISSSVLDCAKRVTNEDEGILVLRVENTEFNRYAAYYITITNECGFDNYTKQIENELGIEIDFIKLNYDFDKCAALLCSNY